MGGLGHDFKAGVNFINEPRLFITFNTGKGAIFNTHLNNDPNGPIPTVTISDGDASANIPTKQFGTYIQDDWRVSDRLTLNLGLRYDLMTGYQFDQSMNPNFVMIQAAGAAGLLNGHRRPRELRPRSAGGHEQLPAAHRRRLDVRGNGKDIIRGGWGIYTDFGYTNSNVLFAAEDATGNGLRPRVQRRQSRRHPQCRRQLLPRRPAAQQHRRARTRSTPASVPLFGQWVDPRLQQP